MELTPIERYFINRFERQEKELEELKESKNDELYAKRVDKTYYTICHSTYDTKYHYPKILKAYKEKNFELLDQYEQRIYLNSYEIELYIGKEVVRIHKYLSNHKFVYQIVDVDDNFFETKEQAQNRLLEEVGKNLKYVEEKYPECTVVKEE